MSTEYKHLIQHIETLRDEPARVHRVLLFERALSELVKARGLKFPKNGSGVILVAGTNGKGSVSKTLETLLASLGYQVGLYTSPHMMQTTERIRSCGKDLTPQEFVRVFEIVQPFVDGLSHFEVLTLMMAEVFFGGRVRPVVDRAVIEVGLGGRLDPTRLVPHAVSVITRLGLDHQELLGHDLASIAREKFAIVDRGNLVVTARIEPEVRSAFEEMKLQSPASVHEAEVSSYRVIRHVDEPRWVIETKWGEAVLNLKGRRAVENTSLALTVLDAMGEDVASCLPELKQVMWPCRMEGFMIDGVRVYLSGDHNAQGIESLVEIIAQFSRTRLRFVVGFGRAKDIDSALGVLSGIEGSELYLTRTPFRGSELSRYGNWLGRAKFSSEDEVETLKRSLADARGTNDLIVVTGSLYLAGNLRSRIVQGEFGAVKPIT